MNAKEFVRRYEEDRRGPRTGCSAGLRQPDASVSITGDEPGYAPGDCSTLTCCEICKQDCGTMAGLIVHVRKFHPASNKELSNAGETGGKE